MRRTISASLETALERTAPTRALWDAWVSHETALNGLTYEDVRVELRTGPPQRRDELLAALVHVANRDPGAFGVVASCLLPGIRRRIFRYGAVMERQDAMAIMAFGLFEAVRRYRTDGPPRFVAKQLLDLPTGRLRAAVAACRAWTSCTEWAVDRTMLAAGPQLPAGTVLGPAVDAGVLGEHDARLIYETRIIGRPLRQVATQLGLRYEAAKKRRRRAELAWVAWWAPERSNEETRP
jgi:hypothetical protein